MSVDILMAKSGSTTSTLMAMHKPLILVLALGLLVRVALWACFAELPIEVVDEQQYNALAIGLVERGEFSFESGQPTSIRPPLYPALLAVIYRLRGLEAFPAVRLVQSALSLLTVVVVYQLGTIAFSRRVGNWSAALTCFYPSLLGANNLLLTEVLFTFFWCLSCLVVVRAWRGQNLRPFALAGVLLGLGALTRSVLWLFPPVLACFIILCWPVAWWRRGAAAALMGLTFAAVVAPWAVRNTQLQQTFIAVDVMGGRNFMMGNYEYTPMFRAWDAISIDGERSWHRVLRRQFPDKHGLTQGQLDKLALRAGLSFVAEHPGLSTQRAVAKFFSFWQLERELVAGASRGYFGPIGRPGLILLTLVIFGSYAAALWSGLLGMFVAPPSDKAVHWFLILGMAYICGIHTLVFGHSRYHLPLIPLVLLYSGSAADRVREIWQRRCSWRFVLAGASCALFGLVWAYEIVVLDAQRYLDALRHL